jgi:hypothetical protein
MATAETANIASAPPVLERPPEVASLLGGSVSGNFLWRALAAAAI